MKPATPAAKGGRLDRVPVIGVLARAVRNYIGHQSANQAGSVAFSFLLSMFPGLLLLSSAASFIGRPGTAASLAAQVIQYAPPVVQDALQPVVRQVLSQRSQALLAVGLFVTVWTASSGMQAIRTALNKAYGVQTSAAFWRARLKVTVFTVIVGLGVVLAFGSVVIMPYVWRLLERTVGAGGETVWLYTSVRYGAASIVVTAAYALLYGWLPDRPQRIRTVLPGAIVGAMLWVCAAALLSYTLRSAGKLALVYGGYTGAVATLVFLYISAVTLIYGAEINAVLGDHGAAGGER